MGRFASMFNGLAKSFLPARRSKSSGEDSGKETAEAMAKDANKNDMMLRSSGTININNAVLVCSKRGEKGVNQDCCIVWEEFGCQKDMIFCGIFDGHGSWGHYVAKRVCDSMPSSLLCNWQEMLLEASLDPKKVDGFHLWKNSFIKTCAAVDQDLQHSRKFDSFHSGTTALTVVRQGELLVIASVGDSRAILATTSEDGCLVPIQLTVFKPNLPFLNIRLVNVSLYMYVSWRMLIHLHTYEAKRILECKGRIFCMEDEPGVHRVWLPHEDSPGLAMSRAFGDYCVKDFGLISVPEVSQRVITCKDQFLVLASDGVWDVISNDEAVEIVSSTVDKSKSVKRLVECAAHAWKRKRKGIPTDDISAVCLFFHSSSPSSRKVTL